MAEYYTQFSCILNVGSTEKADRAEDLAAELAAELDRDDEEALGFEIGRGYPNGQGALWIHSDRHGEPEHVIRFVLRCAEAFDLRGLWGFTWSHSCSQPRLDGYGGGAHVLDLGKRETIADLDCIGFMSDCLARAPAGIEEAP